MKELKEFSLLIKEWETHKDIAMMSNDDVCKFLVLQKIISDTIETLVPIFRKEFLDREIGSFDYNGMKIVTEKENDLSEINVENLFLSLKTDDFLKLVTVVKSKATTPEQKASILLNTVVTEKNGRVVKVKKQTAKDCLLST